MTVALQVAVPESLRPGLEAARAGGGGWVWAAPPRDTARRERRKRLWLERRRARGGDELAAEAALENAAVAAVLAALDREAQAVLLPAEGSGPAWELLEPRPGLRCVDVFWGDCGGEFGFLEWRLTRGEAGPAAEILRSAAVALRATPAVVAFAGGKQPQAEALAQARETAAARLELHPVALYSPLLYAEGRLQAGAMLAKLRAAAGPQPLLLAIPGMTAEELGQAVRRDGGSWAGPFRAGAELPAAKLRPAADSAEVRLTLAGLDRLAGWADSESG